MPPELVARLAELGGRPINLYRALSNSPAMLSAWMEFAWAIRNSCTTPRRLRELMIVRGSQIAGAAYELAHHERMAQAAGVTAEELAALSSWRSSSHFSPAERAALAYEEAVMAMDVSDEVMEPLRSHFSEAEIVELTLTAAAYAAVPRILQALGVPLEEEYRR